MSNVNYISKVYLLGVPLENDYKNTLYFANASAQQTYFQSKIKKSYTDFSYQRKDKYIRIPAGYDEVATCNYVMYQNSNYSNKWYYAFITKLEYINDSVTHVYIETDVFQTWLFDYTVKSSFVEREHVSDDTVGLHTQPEGLETGPYICNGYDDIPELYQNLKIVMGSTEAPSGEGTFIGGTYNGIYSGVQYYTYSAANTTSVIQSLADNGKADALSSLFLAPAFIVPEVGGGPVRETAGPVYFSKSIVKQTALDSYSPHNNKLLTDPYCYLMVTNGNGGSATYQQELFTDSDCGFLVMGALTPGCSIRIVPTHYKNGFASMGHFFDEGLNLGKYPQLNWATDMYTNWLTQTAINTATNIAGGAVTGALTGGLGGALAGAGTTALEGITNAIGQSMIADRMPPQTSGNINCGDVVTSSNHNTFMFYRMSIRSEYAQLIDKYFDMFGYKVNMVKIPNSNHRQRWWYTKTIDVNIDGDIPQEDMQKIKDGYNRGITFWKNASEIENYSLSNSIVS